MWTYKKTKALLTRLTGTPRYRDPYLSSLSYHKKQSRLLSPSTMPYKKSLRSKSTRCCRALSSLENFVDTSHSTPVIAGRASTNYAATSSLVLSTQFANSVLGDRYKNVSLRMRSLCPAGCSQVRILIYFAKRPGINVGLGNTPAEMAQQPDPAFVTVLSDRIHYPGNNAINEWSIDTNVSLKNFTTIYNRGPGVTEKGDLRVLIQTVGTASGAIVHSFQTYYRNM